MTRSITASDLPPDLARFAEAQVAAGRFDSVEDVVEAGLETLRRQERDDAKLAADEEDDRNRPEQPAQASPSRPPFWASFTAQVHALPDEVFERLPADGASEHDHYLYGASKRRV